MSEEFEKKILKKFDTVIKLLTISAMKDKSQKEKIAFLSDSDFSPKEIADLIGTTSNTVSVTLANLKKKKPKVSEQNTVIDGENKSNLG